MTKLEVWLDKLPEDKAKHYNRTRMSMELFARKVGYNATSIIDDFNRHGYVYDERERKVSLSKKPHITKLNAVLRKKRTSGI